MPKIHLLMNEFLRRVVCIWGRVKLCPLGQKTFNVLAVVRGGKTPPGTDSVWQSGDNNRSIDCLKRSVI